MLTTNLLPAEDKKIISLARGARLSVAAAIAVSAILISNAVFVLPTLLPLLYEKTELSRELETGKETQNKFQTSDRQREVRLLTTIIKEIRSHISRPQYASKILAELSGLENAQIKIRTITVAESGAVSITGNAATRKALLDFESALKASPYFTEITSPLSNIIRESNINFSIQGKLKEGLISAK